jgi:hypothetical protein
VFFFYDRFSFIPPVFTETTRNDGVKAEGSP